MTVFARKAYLPDGWADNVRLTLHDDRIVAVESGAKASDTDTQVGVVIPGLCNAHSHAFQRALAGHTEQRAPAGRDNFWTWRERMYALAGKVSAELLTAIARQAYCEMVTAGYTSVAEFHYLHRDPIKEAGDDAMFNAIVQAAKDSGIQLTYVPVHYERAGFEQPQPSTRQASFVSSLDSFITHYRRVTAAPDVNVGIGVHSLRAVTTESLQEISALANDTFVPMHLHIAEQQREVDDCRQYLGRRPVEWLLENVAVGANWCLVHATHIDADETAMLAASGAVVVLCPSTEANLGDGLFPLHRYLSGGGKMAIGSDSHVSINPFEELRWLEYGQRLSAQVRNVVSLRKSHVGHELFDRALEGGSAAAGQELAGLRPDAPADMVALNDDDPMLVGHDDATRLDALVFSGYPLPVERVMTGGKWRVVDGQHIGAEHARDDYAAAVTQLTTGDQ